MSSSQIVKIAGIDYVTKEQHLLRVNDSGSIDVALQDQTSPIVSMLATRELGTLALSGTVAIDDYTAVLVDATDMEVGNSIEFYEEDRFFQAFVIGVVSGTETITMDRPFDFAFTSSASGVRCDHELAVDGSSTPVVYRLTPKYLADGQEWDISSFNINIIDQTAMDDSTFGGISGLARGLLGRVMNGEYHNVYLAKSNGDLQLGFDNVAYSDKAPAGFFSITAKTKIGGQSQLGVVIRLKATDDDEMQIIVQDDLRALDHLHVLISGSVVIP